MPRTLKLYCWPWPVLAPIISRFGGWRAWVYGQHETTVQPHANPSIRPKPLDDLFKYCCHEGSQLPLFWTFQTVPMSNRIVAISSFYQFASTVPPACLQPLSLLFWDSCPGGVYAYQIWRYTLHYRKGSTWSNFNYGLLQRKAWNVFTHRDSLHSIRSWNLYGRSVMWCSCLKQSNGD